MLAEGFEFWLSGVSLACTSLTWQVVTWLTCNEGQFWLSRQLIKHQTDHLANLQDACSIAMANSCRSSYMADRG